MAPSLKELHRLMKNVVRISNKQATINNVNWEGDLNVFTLTVIPNDGVYKNGKFDFMITLHDDYPESPPTVCCTTDIYHPNIDNTENIDPEEDPHCVNVCLNLLDHSTWASTFGLEGVVHGLLFLMHHPNLEDPLSPHFSGDMDFDVFCENVEKFMAGEPIDDGTTFNPGFKVINGVRLDTNDKPVAENVGKTETYVMNKINESMNANGPDHCDTPKGDDIYASEHIISPDNVTVDGTNDADSNIQNGGHIESADDNDEEYVPFKVIDFNGKCAIMFGSLDEDFKTENQDLDTVIIVDDINTVNNEINNMATSEPIETCDVMIGNDIKSALCNITDVDTQTIDPVKPSLTCGLWNSCKRHFTKLLNEIIKHWTKNDVIL